MPQKCSGALSGSDSREAAQVDRCCGGERSYFMGGGQVLDPHPLTDYCILVFIAHLESITFPNFVGLYLITSSKMRVE